MTARKLLHGISMESKKNSLEWQINLKTHLNDIENERKKYHNAETPETLSDIFQNLQIFLSKRIMQGKNINYNLKNSPLLIIFYKDTHEIEIMDLAYANNKT